MNEFWARHNRRIGKMLDQDGRPENWRTRNWYVDIERLEAPATVAAILKQRLAETYLGEIVSEGDAAIRCATSTACALYTVLLIREVLRDCRVSNETFLREGFPTPKVAMRVYRSDREVNLLSIGKKSKRVKLPSVGDLFAYTFDATVFYWGQVTRNDIEHQLGATIAVGFLKDGTPSMDAPPRLGGQALLREQLLIDDGCWKRGLFVTVTNETVRDHLDALPLGTGWMTWESVDAELSAAHDVPLLA